MRAPEFWNQKHGRGSAPLTRSLLVPFSWIYSAISNWRYNRVAPQKLSVPVICVGNISLGGTGKTPLAIAMAKYLIALGKKPAFVSRGYGGQLRGPLQVDPAHHEFKDVGDEPLLLAQTAPTFIAKDRVSAAKMAIKAGAGCIILDDGFQNPSLKKDLAVLVIDAQTGHGNGRVFPAGPLREPVARAVKRADAIVVIGKAGEPDLAGFAHNSYRAFLQTPKAAPKGKLIAFAGIGRPEKFFASLRACGADLEQEIAFADHQPYGNKDVINLLSWKEQAGAKLITTEKDLMRWPQDKRKELLVWPVELKFEPSQDLGKMLEGILPQCQ